MGGAIFSTTQQLHYPFADVAVLSSENTSDKKPIVHTLSLRGFFEGYILVLLRFQKFCRRLVSVGFARKTAVFGSVSVFVCPVFPLSSMWYVYVPTAYQTCSSTLHISVYNSSRQQQVSNSVGLVAWKPPPVPNVARVAKRYLSGSLRHRHPLLVSICTAWRQACSQTDVTGWLQKADMLLFIKHNLPLISFKYWVLSTWNRLLACCA